MKKSIIIGIIILLAVIGFIVIQKNDHHNYDHNHSEENKVAATIFPLYDITQKIAGDEFEVVLVLPSGASPHTFDPQPSLLKDLQGTQAIFAIGHGLDDWSNIIAKSIKASVVHVDHDVELRENENSHDDHVQDYHDGHEEGDHDEYGHDEHEEDSHEGHDHGPIDPHYWLSIHNAEQITLNVAEELAHLDPENEKLYMTRAEQYIKELGNLETELHEKTNQISHKNIISFHDAWYYFAEEFGLNIVGTFEPSAGKEPAPKYIANLKEEVEENSVSVLFMEPQLSQSSIQSFANDHNLSIATIDPLGGVEGRNSYIDLIRYNVEQVVLALGKQ